MSAALRYHRSLSRQLRRLGLSGEPPSDPERWAALLSQVSVAYGEADAERYTLERSIEISSQEMRALHDTLSHRARHDTLTGLPNRAALKEILHAVVAEQRRTGKDAAVLFIDLDGFKLINDSLGHAAGDELLIRVAERIRAAIRPEDSVARLGGDEFVVLCPQVRDLETTTAIARRIGAQLEAPFRLDTHDNANISASIGIALAASAATADELLGNADLAMYEAKAGGRARFLIFDEEMRSRSEGRLATENALRVAVEAGELVLHYQPILDLASRRTLGLEALVRWNRPGDGLVPPGDFIPIAEETRLITLIDRWVLTTACHEAAGWQDPTLGISVNLSARDFLYDGLVEAVGTALHESGLAPHRLTLELTETTAMSGTAPVESALQELRRLGVLLAIDDFGTGSWSVAHLRQLPASSVKIDRSIAADVDHDEAAAAIAGAIIAMSHALGLRVVAEGIERPAQASRLTALGCDAGQGYLFGRPSPLNQATQRAEASASAAETG